MPRRAGRADGPVILPGGTVRAIYAEEIDLDRLGPAVITRASHVEPDDTRPLARRPDPRRRPGPRAVPPAQRGPRRPSWPGSRPTGSPATPDSPASSPRDHPFASPLSLHQIPAARRAPSPRCAAPGAGLRVDAAGGGPK